MASCKTSGLSAVCPTACLTIGQEFENEDRSTCMRRRQSSFYTVRRVFTDGQRHLGCTFYISENSDLVCSFNQHTHLYTYIISSSWLYIDFVCVQQDNKWYQTITSNYEANSKAKKIKHSKSNSFLFFIL